MKIFLIIYLFFYAGLVQAQKIAEKCIVDENGDAIPFVNILLCSGEGLIMHNTLPVSSCLVSKLCFSQKAKRSSIIFLPFLKILEFGKFSQNVSKPEMVLSMIMFVPF